MTNTNNTNEENIHWEESTKHREKFQNKNKSGAIKNLIKTVNLGIKGLNATIMKFPGFGKIEEIDPEKTVAELAEAGGSSFTVGVIDDVLKFVRRKIVPAFQAGGMWTGWVGKAISASIFSMETAVDHLKDLMTSTAISGLSAEIGDLKDGQAKLNAKVDAQGKLMNKRMGDLKAELQGELKQQGEKFEKDIKIQDAKIAANTGAIKQQAEAQKKALQKQKQELESQINEVTNNLNRVESQLTSALNDFCSEVNERFAEQEQKILDNKRKIEEEKRQREEEIREVKDNIKLTTTNLENLRKEKEQIEDEFVNYKSQINQQTAETQQSFEDAQAEFDRRTRIVETQIADNQETLEEFNEQLTDVQREQSYQKAQQEEIIENLQETNDLLFTQQHKLNLVANQMEEIHEEVHDRMDKLSQKLDTRTNETLALAQDASQKLDKLTDQVQNIQKDTENLQEQIKKNKEETEKAKKEAKLANERLDNLLKSQALSDYSQEQSKLDKIQKSLELKAEETKLLATLNLLTETKKLITPEFSEVEWKVGIKEGTEREMPREEGMPLDPNSSWAKKYSPEQLREWGWDTRLLGDNENAPLTDLEKRKPKQAPKNEKNSQAAGEETTQAEENLEKIEELKSETLTRLAEIQQAIRTGLEEIANSQNTSAKPKPAQAKTQAIQQQIQQKKQQLNQKSQTVQNLAKKPYSAKTQKQLEQARKEQEKAEKELEQVQSQLSDPSFQFEQELEKYEDSQQQQKQEEVIQQWQTIQALSQQALQEQPEEKEKPEETKEEDLQKKLEELVQQIKEMDQSAAASQKTMTMFMLFLIIFLLEYVVYKRNGLPGLVILNIILAIAYYHRDTLKEYAELWGKYLLIIGYIMGNVLAYSAPEQEKYKKPAVIGFNLVILAIYAYTLYQKKQEEKKIEAFYQQQTKEITEEFNLSTEWKNIQQNSQPQSGMGGIVDEYSIFSNSEELRTEQINNLKTVSQEKKLTQQKELEIQQQTETLQKAAEIEKNLSKAQEGLGSPRMTWNKIKEIYPQFANKSLLLSEIQKADKLLAKEIKSDQTLTNRLERLPIPSEEETNLLSQLNLTLEQYIAISCKTPYLTEPEKEFISNNYPSLDLPAKLQLINSGLNALEINTVEKKEKFVELILTLSGERELFGLSTKEKENILKFIHTTINLTEEQKNALEEMGIKPYNASEWTVTNEQKDHLLDFGINKLKLTEEQQEQLAIIHSDQFKTFSLTGEQKNILNSLAPLIREDKYSEDCLQLLKSLSLKPTNQTFLVQEEIIPDPNLQFGVSKSNYLPLKIKFLSGEQKTLQKAKELEEKKLGEKEIKENKFSILKSLMVWAEKVRDYDDLKDFNYSLDGWVKEDILTNWQTDILLTVGFKTIPKYNFFELLIFCVEKFTTVNWAEFLSGDEMLAVEFQEYLESLNNPAITINKDIWEKFASSQSKDQRETIQQLNLKELIEEQINKRLGNWKPTEYSTEQPEEIITEETETSERPQPSTSRYDDLFANLNKEEAERKRKKLEREETQKKFQEAERNRREEKLSEKDRKLKEDEERRQKERELAEQEEKKRREVEEARNKSLQAEQQALFNKKMANIEEAKRRAEEALANQIKQNELEEKRKRDEIEKMEKENQAEQERLKKQAELIETEKQKKLAAVALEDKEVRQRIEKQANEEKTRIQEEMNKKRQENERELKKKEAELLRQNQAKQAELDKLKAEVEIQKKAEAETRRIGQEQAQAFQEKAQLQQAIAEESKRMAQHRENMLRSQKNRTNQLETHREYLWNQVLDYYWAGSEAKAGTRSPQQTSGGTLRDWLNSYPNMEFNLYQGDSHQYTNTNWGAFRVAMKAFHGVVGANIFVTQSRFRELLQQRVNDTSIGMD